MNQACIPAIENTPDSQCPRCQVKYVKGQAFVQPPAPILEVGNDTDFTAKLVRCMKCPRCGYSERLQDDNELPWPVRYMSATVHAHYEVFGRTGLSWDNSTRQYIINEKFTQR